LLFSFWLSLTKPSVSAGIPVISFPIHKAPQLTPSIATELWDLEYTGSAFVTEVSAWSCPLLVGTQKYSVCANGDYVMGGYDIMGGSGTTGSSAYYGNYWTRYYTGLPAHNQVNVTYSVYPIDSWDGTTSDDHYSVSVDGVIITCWHFTYTSSYAYSYCGGSFVEFPIVRVYMTWPHTASTMTLDFINYLDQDSTDESLGIREIQMDFLTVTSPVESVCGVASVPLPSWPCPCATNQYMSPAGSGTCYNCYSTCATCTGGASTDCTSCISGYYLSGDQCLQCSSNCATCSGTATTCTSCNSGWFMVGTTCYSSCNSPLYSYVSNGVTYCATPCPGEYVMWDGSCSTTCAYSTAYSTFAISAVTVDTFEECTYPCPSNEYLYFNGSCLSSCPSPLTTLTYYSRGFCDYSCPSSDYLYWNGSCLGTCPSPLSGEVEGTTTTRKFCWYTCQPNQYLYWNGSCLSTCPAPLSGETEGTYLQRKFCWYTCQPTEYLYWNESCLSTCPPPLSPETQGTNLPRQFCWYTCQPDQYLYWNGSCLSTCPSPLSGELEGTYLQRYFCWYTCQPDQYLYWNESCLSLCPSPLSGELQGTYLQRNFCWYTCQPDEYLYWNGSCLSTCPSPLSGETQGTYLERNFCWYICMPWQWLYWDETCQQSCDFPLWPEVQGTYLERNFCWYSCEPDQFVYWNGTCSSTCPEPLTNEYHNGRWFCVYPCETTQYLYWNGSCLDTCPSPLVIVTQGTPSRQFCDYPCAVDEFLYWDGSCQTSCDSPLVPMAEGTPERQFCWYLCGTSEYLYWNGTCSSQCDSPLVQSTSDNRNYCSYPCTSDQYLAWNGSCLSSCPYPFVAQVQGDPIQNNFCYYPCDPSEYLYWNGSCLTTCDSPLSTRIEGSLTQRKFCDYPCVGNQYLYWNGTCSTRCHLPLIVRIDIDKRYCDYLCPASEIIYWDGSCSTSCPSPLVSQSQGAPTRNYCRYPCLGNQFLYWNGSCLGTCDFPLTSYASKSRSFCNYTCETDQFLYFNGSCLSTCPIPYSTRIEEDLQYCDYSCEISEYLYWNGSCIESCSSPLVQSTTDRYLYCDFPCNDKSAILYWNGTCGSDCPKPLTLESQGSSRVRRFCYSKCSATQYLYWNSTCSDSCDFPLAVEEIPPDVRFCIYPCETDQYLYWNGSCLDFCESPLSSRIQDSLNYCDYPCSESTYLYWDGSCLPQCLSPLSAQTVNDKLYCIFPCSYITDYLYWNGTCDPECKSPLTSKTEDNINYCQNPCDLSDYLYWNGSCLNTCPSPLTSYTTDDSSSYCNSPCGNIMLYYYPDLERCDTTCHQPAFIQNSTGYLTCNSIETSSASTYSGSFFLNAPLEQGAWTVVKLVKTMQYVKYLDIQMPPRLQRLTISKGRDLLSINSGISMPEALIEKFTNNKATVPYVYLKNNLHSSFLVNFWDDLMTILIALGLAVIFSALQKIFKAFDWAYLVNIFSTLKNITKWNFPLMILAINVDNIILFSAIQFKTFSSSTSEASFSLFLSVVFIIVTLTLMGLVSYIALSLRKSPSKKFPGFQVLYSAFRNNNLFNQLFFMFYMLRIGLPILIAVCFESYPLLVSLPQIIISLAILAFILRMKPFIKKINHYQMVIFESVILLMNCCMLALTILSHYNLQNHQLAIVLGDIVILGNDCLNLMCLFFLILQIHSEALLMKNLFVKTSMDKPQRIGICCRLLFFLLQQGNMGFEEVIYYPENVKPKRVSKILYVEEDDRANLDFTNIHEDQLSLVRGKRPLESRSIDGDQTRLSKRESEDFETFAETARSPEQVIFIKEESGAEDTSRSLVVKKQFNWHGSDAQKDERVRNNLIGISQGLGNKTTFGSNIFEKSLFKKEDLEFSVSNQDSLRSIFDKKGNLISPMGSSDLFFDWKEQKEDPLPHFGSGSGSGLHNKNSERMKKFRSNLRTQEKKKGIQQSEVEDDEAIFQKIQSNLQNLNHIVNEEEKPKVKHEYLRKRVMRKETVENPNIEDFNSHIWKKGRQHFKPNYS